MLSLSASDFRVFLSLIQSSPPAQSVAILSQTFPRLLPPPLVFPFSVLHRIIFHSFSVYGMPPLRTSPPEDLLQGIDDCIWSLITYPSHGSPLASSNYFKHKEYGVIAGSFMEIYPCFILPSFESDDDRQSPTS